MISVATAVVAMATLQAGSVWITARGSAFVDQETLPARVRNRLQWWLRHQRHAYAVCAGAFMAAGLTQLVPLLI